MNILIYGGGAIGSHIAYCLYSSENKISLISRGEHYLNIKKNGINLNIFDNEILVKKSNLKENSNIKFFQNIEALEEKKFDYIFITVKLKDYKHEEIKKINSLINSDTAIIPPCTCLPDWWFHKVFNKNENLSKEFFIIKNEENVIGMTMWLSSVIEKPGNINVKHIQRGYPLKELNDKMKPKADALRNMMKKKCISPKVENIFSEIYGKVINSFAFNLVALDTELNNFDLKNNSDALNSIKNIMKEFDHIMTFLKIPLFQSIDERINQTLQSTKHTMSMLTDYKRNKKIEINYSWINLKLLLELTGKEAPYSYEIYERVLKKISKKNYV